MTIEKEKSSSQQQQHHNSTSTTTANTAPTTSTSSSTTTSAPALVARPPLDVYKKITIIRRSTDSVTFEDSEGRLHRISDLGEAATSSAPTLTPKKKLDIPTPRITNVESYHRDVLPNYNLPSSYVRFVSGSKEKEDEEGMMGTIEYNADEEDEEWLLNHEKFGPLVVMRALVEGGNETATEDDEGVLSAEEKSSDEDLDTKSAAAAAALATSAGSEKSEKKKQKKKSSSEKSSDKKDAVDTTVPSTTTTDTTASETTDATDTKRDKLISSSDSEEENINLSTPRRHPRLPISLFEVMLNALEKATAFETIITLSQAERLLVSKLPVLLHIFGSTLPKNKTNVAAAAARKRRFSTTSEPPTLKYVISEVYNYWVAKRSKLKRPLLRQYWPVTSSNDTNPHMVFRPREKEKYKLRKKRQNDMDAYRKMVQLKADFEKVKRLLDLVRKREKIGRYLLDVGCEVLEQRIYDAVDTSGLKRCSRIVGRKSLEEVMDLPKYFDTSFVGGYGSGGGGKKKKRRRVSGGNANDRGGNLASAGGRNRGGASSPPPPGTDDANATTSTGATPLIAGQDHGHPAPLFLHPLPSRESYVTSWENAVPFVSSYLNGHATPTFRFRHRPRVGRGGRIVMDRLPCPGGTGLLSSGAAVAPVTVYTAGDGLPRFASKNGDNGNNNEDGGEKKDRGNEESGPGPADRLADLLPSPLDRDRISKRIEEICAEALSDDEDDVSIGGRPASVASSSAIGGGVGATGIGGYGSSSTLSAAMGGGNIGSGSASGGGAGTAGGGSSSGGMDVDENDGDEVFVRVDDWLDTDEQVWGEERFVIGPV